MFWIKFRGKTKFKENLNCQKLNLIMSHSLPATNELLTTFAHPSAHISSGSCTPNCTACYSLSQGARRKKRGKSTDKRHRTFLQLPAVWQRRELPSTIYMGVSSKEHTWAWGSRACSELTHHLCRPVSGAPRQSKDFLQFGVHCGAFCTRFLEGTGTDQLRMLHERCVAEAAALTLYVSSFLFIYLVFPSFFPECPQSRLQINDSLLNVLALVSQQLFIDINGIIFPCD